MPDYEDRGADWTPDEARWRPRARLPHRLGPIARTRAEVAGFGALIAAGVSLAVGAVSGADWGLFLIFPAFGIPDLLLAWYRWTRWKRAARWSRDLRATMLLAGLTVYLAVRVPVGRGPVPLGGVIGGVVLAATTATIWTVRVIRDRRR